MIEMPLQISEARMDCLNKYCWDTCLSVWKIMLPPSICENQYQMDQTL